MPASRPPGVDVSSSEDRPEPPLFAWGKTPESTAQTVGREPELARLSRMLTAARTGSTSTLLLEGEPGIGKTTLLEAVAGRATGFRCLRVNGIESESVLPYAGLLQALGPIRGRTTEIPPGQAAALSQALGWGPMQHPHERFLVAAAVLSMLAAQAEREPVLVVVDDAQWVDRESAAALAFAARRLRDVPVCIVWTARTGSVPPDLAAGIEVLTLAGLRLEAARTLLPRGVSERVAERLVELTGGNPLAISEVGHGLSDAQRVGAAPLPARLPVSERLLATYRRKIATLPGPVRRMLLIVALDGSGRSAPVADSLLRQGEDAAALLDAAHDHGVLTQRGPVLEFRHPLLRTAVVAQSSTADRRRAHRILAEVLATEPPSVAGAWHRAEAAVGSDQVVARELAEVAERSRRWHGYAAASAVMERAALLSDDTGCRADWMATAAEDAFLAGDTGRTRALAARVLDGSSPRQIEGRALFVLGMIEQYAGSVPQSVELLASAADRLEAGARTTALAELALARFRLNDVDGIDECALAIVEVADRADPEQRMLSDFTRGVAAVLRGHPDDGRSLLLSVTEQITCPPLREDPRTLLFLCLAGGFLGDPHVVKELASYQLREARSRGALGVLVPSLAIAASGRAWIGDHAGAYADAGEAAELGDQLGYAADTAVAVEMLAWQSAARGLHDEARAALERARSLTDRAATTGFAAHQAITAAFCALCRDDPGHAAGLLEARIAADGGVGSMGEPLGVAPDLVEAYTALGRQADASAITERFAAATPITAAPRLRALVARCRGLAAEDLDSATRAFEMALAAHAESPDPFEAARTRLLYGAWLRRSGQRVRARAELTAAHDAFAEMDLTVWLRRAESELAATGSRPRSRVPQVPEPLTAQETRVALHAADGLSNKEIAAALFLSPKTIEHHLSSVYRKRGYRSRAELAASFRPHENRPR